MKLTTEKIVAHIVESYEKAAKAMEKAQSHGAEMSSWMDSATFEQDADAIQQAYNDGKFENVKQSDIDSLMEKYGASDIYHLVASYFNATGKILNIED